MYGSQPCFRGVEGGGGGRAWYLRGAQKTTYQKNEGNPSSVRSGPAYNRSSGVSYSSRAPALPRIYSAIMTVVAKWNACCGDRISRKDHQDNESAAAADTTNTYVVYLGSNVVHRVCKQALLHE